METQYSIIPTFHYSNHRAKFFITDSSGQVNPPVVLGSPGEDALEAFSSGSR